MHILTAFYDSRAPKALKTVLGVEMIIIISQRRLPLKITVCVLYYTVIITTMTSHNNYILPKLFIPDPTIRMEVNKNSSRG